MYLRRFAKPDLGLQPNLGRSSCTCADEFHVLARSGLFMTSPSPTEPCRTHLQKKLFADPSAQVLEMDPGILNPRPLPPRGDCGPLQEPYLPGQGMLLPRRARRHGEALAGSFSTSPALEAIVAMAFASPP